eukprot:TRINITY_DN4621_c0_g1_i3.p2 TRINITY_DN4621_c0_g1~~TRINITY_DN4621_c0_g1_i3.p2  ORF type:complete len:147 (-),score=29.28 TRINITY_DN4621_c0_g1_i3:593-1033(-)
MYGRIFRTTTKKFISNNSQAPDPSHVTRDPSFQFRVFCIPIPRVQMSMRIQGRRWENNFFFEILKIFGREVRVGMKGDIPEERKNATWSTNRMKRNEDGLSHQPERKNPRACTCLLSLGASQTKISPRDPLTRKSELTSRHQTRSV